MATSTIVIPNKLCKLIVEKASNNLQRFRFSIKQGGTDHSSDFDRGGKRILIWHHIVNGVLVDRHLSEDIYEWSPYYFLEEKAKMSCVIGRVFRVDFDPSIAGDHFNVGTESQIENDDLHICVSLKDNVVIIIEEDPIDPGILNKNPNFADSIEKIWAFGPWEKDANFKINGEAGAKELRFSYDYPDSVGTGIPCNPIWYFYTQGHDKMPIVRLENAPIVKWEELREFYNDNNKSLSQEGISATLREAGFYVMLRFHLTASVGKVPNIPSNSDELERDSRESDVGQSNPGGPPSDE